MFSEGRDKGALETKRLNSNECKLAMLLKNFLS